ncbi:MAG: GFA family protein [Emcibacteraceae bacterium]
MTKQKKLAGKCLCGAVNYAVDDNFEYAMNCHCSNCRRSTGSAFKSFAGIRKEHLKLVKGGENILKYGDDLNYDIHCGTCGSLLYSMVRDGEYAHVTMGTLVDTPSIKPQMHIFVGSKAPWFEITDDLPQFDQLPE